MRYSAYKLSKQGDNIQPWCTPFPIWNQSVVPCPVLTVASWPEYRFLKRQFRWSGIPISFRFSSVYCDPYTGFGIVNKAEIDVFLELSCFFNDLADVHNLISGSSAFSKTSLNIWKFTVHILLKPVLEHPTPVLLPGKSHGWRSMVGCSPWGLKESDTTERLYSLTHAKINPKA